ncbi:hypothetical protein NKH77_09260 [Streptomyces sp. M19]
MTTGKRRPAAGRGRGGAADSGPGSAAARQGVAGKPSADRRAVLLWAGLHGTVGLHFAMPVAPDLDGICLLADELVDTILAG